MAVVGPLYFSISSQIGEFSGIPKWGEFMVGTIMWLHIFLIYRLTYFATNQCDKIKIRAVSGILFMAMLVMPLTPLDGNWSPRNYLDSKISRDPNINFINKATALTRGHPMEAIGFFPKTASVKPIVFWEAEKSGRAKDGEMWWEYIKTISNHGSQFIFVTNKGSGAANGSQI